MKPQLPAALSNIVNLTSISAGTCVSLPQSLPDCRRLKSSYQLSPNKPRTFSNARLAST
jgi:hypothetical protein